MGLVMNDLCLRPNDRRGDPYWNYFGWCEDIVTDRDLASCVSIGGFDALGLRIGSHPLKQKHPSLARAVVRTL